eukprot:1158423-Pelagomonas_calceolata.AAC.6
MLLCSTSHSLAARSLPIPQAYQAQGRKNPTCPMEFYPTAPFTRWLQVPCPPHKYLWWIAATTIPKPSRWLPFLGFSFLTFGLLLLLLQTRWADGRCAHGLAALLGAVGGPVLCHVRKGGAIYFVAHRAYLVALRWDASSTSETSCNNPAGLGPSVGFLT